MSDLRVAAEPGVPIIITERSFNASRDKVFAAFVEKDKLERWWVTAPGYSIRVDTLEARTGGRWRFVSIDKNTNQEYVFFGSFHEVSAPERIVWTFEFEQMPERGHVSLERFEFIEKDPATTLIRTTSTFLSMADRDWIVQSGTGDGLEKSYGHLDRLLEI
jgi:uncharacterized protein YndB with AHSA1/START domain